MSEGIVLRIALRKLLIGTAILVAVPVLVELGFRALESPLGVDREALRYTRAFVCAGDTGWYEPHPYCVFTKRINAFGFNDVEWEPARTEGLARILCMGGSTTEGGNAQGRTGAYPYLLEQTLERRCGRDFEVLNAGMSYWTSAELLTAWFLLLQDLRPDVLVLSSGINDCEPRAWPGFRADYRHFRHPLRTPDFGTLQRFLTRWSDLFAWVQRKANLIEIVELTRFPLVGSSEFQRTGKLDPATARSFRRNIESIGDSAQAHGARILLMTEPLQPPSAESRHEHGHYFAGVAEHNEILRELAREKGWLLADAARMDELDEERRRALFLTLAHVTPEGNQMKADYIVEALARDWPAQLGDCAGR